jgi:hypothetical protein
MFSMSNLSGKANSRAPPTFEKPAKAYLADFEKSTAERPPLLKTGRG